MTDLCTSHNGKTIVFHNYKHSAGPKANVKGLYWFGSGWCVFKSDKVNLVVYFLIDKKQMS